MIRLETKDGIKEVDYFDAKFAAKALTLEGWQRYYKGETIQLQDFKVDFLERILK